MQCSLATGHIPAELFPPPLSGELRSYLPPEARVTELAIMLYLAGITPWSWAREPDWLRAHDPDITREQIADKAVHDWLFGCALDAALAEAEGLANASGRTLFPTAAEEAQP